MNQISPLYKPEINTVADMETKVKTEIYSRVSGYFRPVQNWNNAKREEFSERRNLKYEVN